MAADISYRVATSADAQAITDARAPDVEAGPADRRVARYLDGEHHPQKSFAARTGYVAELDGAIVGYTAGHLSERFDCEGELQYLWVAPERRRAGIATALTRLMAAWFRESGAKRVCAGSDYENVPCRGFLISHGATDIAPGFMVWDDITGVDFG